jgi:hypothetical protein
MADGTVQNAPPTTDIPQAPGAPAVQSVPGTNINVPVGSGVERIIPVPAPFQSQSPPWYTPPNTVWGQMGCAVPQAGVQIQTNNSVIFDLVKFVGRGLFDVAWNFSADRLSEAWPSKLALWEMHQLLVTCRTRLTSITNPPGANPLVPAKAGAAPQMFLVYPVPLYGSLGAVNQFFKQFELLSLRALGDAMQHSDNAIDFYVNKTFMNAVYPYIKYLLSQMAQKFFGEDATLSQADDYVIPAAKWAAYDPATQAVSFEATGATPPLNYVGPTPIDLQKIMGLTYEQVTPFLQQWPDAQYVMISGGIWSNSSSPASDPTTKAGAAAGGASPALFTTGGPPTA